MDLSHPAQSGDPHAEIRDEVAKLCARFPGDYWRKLDRDRAYPTEFVQRADRGRLSRRADPRGIRRRRPAALGRGGDPGGRSTPRAATAPPATPRCTSWAPSCGTASPKQKKELPAEDRHRRAAPAGVRRHRADQRHRHHRAAHLRQARGRPLRRQRPEGVDQPRRAFRPDAAAGPHHAARPGEASAPTGSRPSSSTCARRSGNGLTIRPIRTMMNHNTTEVFFDNMVVPAENLVGEEGRGFRYILDGMNAERLLIAAECIGDARWFIEKATDYAQATAVCSAGRSARTRASSSRSPRAYAQMRAAELMVPRGLRQVRGRPDPAARKPTWPRCSAPMPPGPRPRPACRPMAASASPRNTTSSASSARRGSIRWRRSAPT